MTGLLREHLRAGLDATRTVREAARSRRKPTDLQEDLAAFRAKAIAKGLPDPREDLLPARPTRPTRPRVTGKQRKS
jgi:hypothetical protein